jgi:hypothetical protein
MSVALGNRTNQNPVNYVAGNSPAAIVSGDFNGDGKPDIAVASDGAEAHDDPGILSVFIGNGDGTFQQAVNYTIGVYPQSLAIGDFNGDGFIDIAVTNQVDDTMTVLSGNGNGTFQAGTTYAVGTAPEQIVVGDFNGDGRADIAVANSGDSTVSVFLGLPPANLAPQTITFGPLSNVAYGSAPVSLTATASSGLAVSFASTTTGVCTLSGATVTILAVGMCSITASQGGNSNYLPAASVTQSFNVTAVIVQGPSEAGIFRRGNQWLLDLNNDRVYEGPPQDIYYVNFITPQPGDLPVGGDWSGSGTTKIGIYRPSSGEWFLDYNGDGVFDAGDKTYFFGGIAGDLPVVGDWSGSGTAKIGIFRSGYFWILDYNGDGTYDNGDQAFAYGGVAGDVPVAGDWTGNGIAKVGVVRPFQTGGTPAFWLLDANNDHAIDTGDLIFAFGGITGDVAVVGDWNGTGFAKAGVYRDGFYWVVDNNGSAPTVLGSSQVVAFAYGGIAGDVPITGKW